MPEKMTETLEGFTAPRRLPSRDKSICEIEKNDVRVRIFGIAIDSRDNTLVIDDGTGKINAVFSDAVNVKPNSHVRVFGRVMQTQDGFEIEGEILQDMGRADARLYKKVVELERQI